MSILRPEVAPTYGALDSDALVELELPDAHAMRAIISGANRLLCRPEPLLNLIWDVGSTAVEGGGAVSGYAPPLWMPVITGPIACTKKPGLTVGVLYVRAKITSGETVRAQVSTRARPFVEAGGELLTMVGTGAWADYTLESVPLHYGVDEDVAVHVFGEVSTTLGDEATYGDFNAGVVDNFFNGDTIADAESNWTVTGAGPSWALGHVIVCTGSTNNTLLTRWIVNVSDEQILSVHPPFNASTGALLVGSNFKIYELPHIQLGQVALYAQERVA